MDERLVRIHIEKFLSGKYIKPVDSFCLYQWLERCAYHKWTELGLNLYKCLHSEQFEKPLQDRIHYLVRELQRQLSDPPQVVKIEKEITRTSVKRRPRGEITTTTAYRAAIIEALNELGGRGKTRIIAEMVERKMRPVLRDVDYTIRASDHQPIWYNTMNWEKFVMTQDGILKKGLPKGIWELNKRSM